MTSSEFPPADPAADIALSLDEIDWLGEFLASDEVPDTAMPLEALDGFLTALAIGPESVPPAEYLPVIWDTEQRTDAVFNDTKALQLFAGLVARHCTAITQRIDAGYRHLPLLEDERPGQDGCAWCYGFVVGIGMRLTAWQPLLKNKKTGPAIALIAVLSEADELSDMEPTLPEDRAEIIDALSAIPPLLREFWHNRAAGRHHPTKIGGNDPCPCGSGRKYKRCCGAGGGSAD